MLQENLELDKICTAWSHIFSALIYNGKFGVEWQNEPCESHSLGFAWFYSAEDEASLTADQEEQQKRERKKKTREKAEQSKHMFHWPTMTQGRKREPEGPIVSTHQKAALTITSAVSKADTEPRRGPIL